MKTKFDIGEQVFYFKYDVIESSFVTDIHICCSNVWVDEWDRFVDGISTETYTLYNQTEIDACSLFASAEDALDNIRGIVEQITL